MPLNKIGTFEFTRFLSPPPPSPRQQFMNETRAGRDGFATMYLGRWGEPFNLVAESVFPDQSSAETAKVNYQNSPSLAFGNIIYADVDYSEQGMQFMIQGVEVQSMRRVVHWMDSTVAYPGGWVVETNFTLIGRFTP
jgi:hypothetical protein